MRFDGEKARVALAAGYPANNFQVPARYRATTSKYFGKNGEYPYVNVSAKGLHPDEYHVKAPSAQRAEQIARAMRRPEKEEA